MYNWEKESKGETPMAEKTTTVKSVAKEETAVKTAVPAAEAKEPEKKEEVKEVKKEEKAPARKETKTAAKKTTARKPAVKKTTTKKAAAKAEEEPVVKAEEKPVAKRETKKAVTPVVHLQFSNKAYSIEDLQKIANDVWKFDLHNEESYTSLELYVKPEESVAYYVFNGDITGHFFI